MVEVTLALGIITIAIVSTLGLLAVGLNMNRDSVANTEAASVAREIAADLQMIEDWSDATAQSPRLQITPTPDTSLRYYVQQDGRYLPASSTTETERITSRFRVDISFGPSSNNQPPIIHLLVSWPTGTAGNGTWPARESATFETVSSLNPL